MTAVYPPGRGCAAAREKRNRSVVGSLGGSGERGEWIAAVVSGDQVAEVGEQRAVLQAARRCGRQGAFGEPLAVFGLGPERDFAVDDRRAQRAFGGVIGRLNSLDGHERPERGPDLE